jgi:SAM-dependent methyltransferase
MQRDIKSKDVYGRTFQLDETALAAMATRLEVRGKHPFFARVNDEYLARFDLGRLQGIIEIGTGTGIVARNIAKRRQFGGTILATDISEYLIERARQFAEEESVAARIEFRVADAHSTGDDAAGADVVIAHTLVSHVTDPVAILTEAKRLLRPGGRVVIFDGDYASMTFTTESPDHGKGQDETLINALVAHPRVMRIMPRLLKESGLVLRDATSYVVADIGAADFFKAALPLFRILLPRAGAMTEASAIEYVSTLEAASDKGYFFGASNFYTYIAERPA